MAEDRQVAIGSALFSSPVRLVKFARPCPSSLADCGRNGKLKFATEARYPLCRIAARRIMQPHLGSRMAFYDS